MDKWRSVKFEISWVTCTLRENTVTKRTHNTTMDRKRITDMV
jgi:hypothetical protein